MRKLVSLFLATVMLVLALCSCKSTSKDVSSEMRSSDGNDGRPEYTELYLNDTFSIPADASILPENNAEPMMQIADVPINLFIPVGNFIENFNQSKYRTLSEYNPDRIIVKREDSFNITFDIADDQMFTYEVSVFNPYGQAASLSECLLMSVLPYNEGNDVGQKYSYSTQFFDESGVDKRTRLLKLPGGFGVGSSFKEFYDWVNKTNGDFAKAAMYDNNKAPLYPNFNEIGAKAIFNYNFAKSDTKYTYLDIDLIVDADDATIRDFTIQFVYTSVRPALG